MSVLHAPNRVVALGQEMSWISNLVGALGATLFLCLGAIVLWAAWHEHNSGGIFSGVLIGSIGLLGLFSLIRGARAYTQKQLQVDGLGFWLQGTKFVSFDSVKHLRFYYVVTQKRLNFARSGDDHNVEVDITLDGELRPLKFRSGPALALSYGSFGKRDGDELISKYRAICEGSFPARSGSYIDEVRRNGYFAYDGKRVCVDGNVSFAGGSVSLRTSTLTREPFALSLGKQRIRTQVDADVFFWLLEMLFGITIGANDVVRTTRMAPGLSGIPRQGHLDWLKKHDDEAGHRTFDAEFGSGAAKRFMRAMTGRM
jgi:hypothetical protein